MAFALVALVAPAGASLQDVRRHGRRDVRGEPARVLAPRCGAHSGARALATPHQRCPARRRHRRRRCRALEALPGRRAVSVLHSPSSRRCSSSARRARLHLACRARPSALQLLRDLRRRVPCLLPRSPPTSARTSCGSASSPLPIAALALSLRRWKPLLPALAALGSRSRGTSRRSSSSYARGRSDPSSSAAYWAPAIHFLHDQARARPTASRLSTRRATGRPTTSPRRASRSSAAGFARTTSPRTPFSITRSQRGPTCAGCTEMAVRYVVLTNAPVDYSSQSEARLLRSGRSGLDVVFRSANITIFAVPSPQPIVTGPGTAARARAAKQQHRDRRAPRRHLPRRAALHPVLVRPRCMHRRDTASGLIELRAPRKRRDPAQLRGDGVERTRRARGQPELVQRASRGAQHRSRSLSAAACRPPASSAERPATPVGSRPLASGLELREARRTGSSLVRGRTRREWRTGGRGVFTSTAPTARRRGPAPSRRLSSSPCWPMGAPRSISALRSARSPPAATRP